MAARTHVWLLSLGAPAAPDGAAAWISALWRDNDAVLLSVPWLRRLLGWLVARWRAPALADRCAALDGETRRWADLELQARDLGRILGPHYAVRPVLRYAGPSAEQAAKDAGRKDAVVLVPLDAHVGGATTISPLRHALTCLGHDRSSVARVQGYPDHPLYVDAVAETLREAIMGLPQGVSAYTVVFCARGLPGRTGTYQKQVEATVTAVVAATGLGRPHHLAYTRAATLGRGPRPQIEALVQKLGRDGVTALVVVPVGFTSDHVETRVELDRDLAAVAKEAGIQHLVRAPTVATRPTFLRALAALVREAEDAAGWDVPWRQLPAATGEA